MARVNARGVVDMKERLKSKVVWLSVLAQVIIIVGLFTPNISEYVKVIGTCLIEIATLFGILNNPTDRDNF